MGCLGQETFGHRVLSAVGFRRGGQQHPLFYTGNGLVVVVCAVWATWLGRLLQTGALAT